MRILYVTGLTAYGVGGARAEATQLLGGLLARGCAVALASDIVPEPLAELSQQLSQQPHSPLAGREVTHYPLDYPQQAKSAAQIRAAVAAHRPDLVHVLGGGIRFMRLCDRVFGGDARRGGGGVPWVFTAHNVPPAERIFHGLFADTRLHYAVRDVLALPSVVSWGRFLSRGSFRRVICHSRPVADRLAARGCPPERIVSIPFGYDPLPPAPREAAPPESHNGDGASCASCDGPPFPADAYPKILTVAGLAPHKGQTDFLRAARELLADHPRLHYCMIGMGRSDAYRAYLDRLIADSGLAGHVTVLHAAAEPAKLAALREADLYVQPSHEEGFCIAFLEAAAAVPRLLGTTAGEMPLIADGDPAAAIVPTMDPPALAAAARRLLAEPVPPGVLARRCRRLARRYRWDEFLDGHLAVYAEALGQAPATVARGAVRGPPPRRHADPVKFPPPPHGAPGGPRRGRLNPHGARRDGVRDGE